MKILSIGSDRNLFLEGSDVRSRVIDYGKLCDELHIVVFTNKKLKVPIKSRILDKVGTKSQKLSANVWVYPTNSINRWFYIFDAIKIGKKLMKLKASAQGGPASGRNEVPVESRILDKVGAKSWLVTCQDPFESGLVGWRLKKKFNLPLQLQIHTDLFSPYFTKGYILNKIRVKIAKFLLPKADCIRVVSERIKNSLLDSRFKILDSKIMVLPIYVDIEKIRQMPVNVDLHQKYNNFNFIFLMASRITKEKNILLAIGAMKEIIKKYPKTLLLIVGSGPEKKNLQLSTYNLELEDNIRFEDAVSFEKLISYYKTADTYLLSSNYEGYGRTIVEAAASECPVITTDVGIAGEIEGLKVIPVNSKKELVYAIFEHIENPLKAPKLPKIGDYRAYLELYKQSWEKCKKEI